MPIPIEVDEEVGKVVFNEKHGVGVIVTKDNKINPEYQFDSWSQPATGRAFHSGIDPLDDIQIAVASKKKFMDWWKQRTGSYPIRNVKGVVDSGKVIRMTKDGIDIIGATFSCFDLELEEFPFRLNNVDTFGIELPELHSLKNLPRSCKSAQYGSTQKPMKYMDTLVGGVQKAVSIIVNTESPFLNLETSLRDELVNLTICAPSFASFEGLNVNVQTICLHATRNQSFKGIHKAFNQETANICRISVGVNRIFDGGVLPFAMLDPSIEVIPDVSGNPPEQFVTAMEVVAASRKEGMNVHDIQELLIDKGLGKYARL